MAMFGQRPRASAFVVPPDPSALGISPADVRSLFGQSGTATMDRGDMPAVASGPTLGVGSVPPSAMRQSAIAGASPSPSLPVMAGAAPSVPGAPDAQPAAAAPLGGSMVHPFDYQAAMSSMLPAAPQHSPAHERLVRLAQIIGPALMAAAGNQQGANAAISDMRQARAAQGERQFAAAKALAAWKHEDWARQNGADLDAAAPFTIGRDRMGYNPATGEVGTLYHGQSDAETYAASQGLTPGTPAYNGAVQDFVLRSNGPSALDRDEQLDDHRTGNRVRVEGVQQAGRMAVHSAPSYSDLHPRAGGSGGGAPAGSPNSTSAVYGRVLAKVAAGQSLTAGEQQVLGMYHGHGSKGGGAGSGGAGNIPVMQSPADAMRLPPGTVFRTPDGRVKTR